MTKIKWYKTEEFIPHGARVLARYGRCSLAPVDLANATANETSNAGGFISVTLDADIGARDLHAIANGPIMDPRELFLPAGKVSTEEAKRREAEQVTVVS